MLTLPGKLRDVWSNTGTQSGYGLSIGAFGGKPGQENGMLSDLLSDIVVDDAIGYTSPYL